MIEAVVLFLHHRSDSLSSEQLDLLRANNGCQVVPLFCDDGQQGSPLPNAVQVPMTFTQGFNWHNIDWICRDWYLSEKRIDAERDILVGLGLPGRHQPEALVWRYVGKRFCWHQNCETAKILVLVQGATRFLAS